MKKFYLKLILIVLIFCHASASLAQNCSLLTAAIQSNESRCASTGSIDITASGGSGSYKYKVEGPINIDYTTSSSITGLSAGVYTVIVNDIISNCIYKKTDVTVIGSYQDPRFGLEGLNVTCDNGDNGSIKADGLEHGIAPFSYTIVAPSPMGIGTSNNTGIFKNLIAGDYSIQLMDSCGGIQTRTVTINNYTWKIDSHTMIKFSCDSAKGSIRASDNRGNVSTIHGINGFHFGYITPTGDTTWSENPNLNIGAYGLSSVVLVVKDVCGKIKTITASLSFTPSLNNNLLISAKECKDFSAAVTGILNFTNPIFSLYDNDNVLVASNSTGKFTALSYGKNYCIRALDECSGNTISRCFTEPPLPIFIDKSVVISNENCETFNAAVTGLNGFTNPFFILTKDGAYVTNNVTGVFKNLPYGNYCILTQDACRDTSITQCFTAAPPVPRVDPVIIPYYVNCVDFGIKVGGVNLTRPRYCLYDTANVELACNNTGIFDNILLGSYCVTIYDDCIDTTFVRCFSVGPPVVPNDVTVDKTNKSCSTFTASVNTQNFTNAAYCLYSKDSVLIRCDSSGIFSNLPYGEYYITSTSFCPDTTVLKSFSASAPIPKTNIHPQVLNKTCNTFTARITGQVNLTNPEYFLLDQNNQIIASNATGTFDNLLYGSYCIRVVNQCYDTTMIRCVTSAPTPIDLTVSAMRSCNYGTSKFSINVSGNFPANVTILNPGGNIIYNISQPGQSHIVDNLPDLKTGQFYTIIATDNCGNVKTITKAPEVGYLNHTSTISNKCPGSIWPNGSGNIHTTVSTNTGTPTVRIIKKDLVSISPSLTPNSIVGNTYSFNDLGPGSYIIRYNTTDGCNVFQFDTVVIRPYAYPELTKSSAYQCDVNGFSVGAVVSNGVGPFSYSIIGSLPDAPSIMQGPQANPVFKIDNGNTYSLIRLRALDACGNATLGDASILPLANTKIITSANCFDYPVELTIDSMSNSTATWYKKNKPGDTDSIEVGNGFNFYIERLLEKDTGIYICHMKVNSGCIERVYYIKINGDCYPALPVLLSNLEGRFEKNKVILNWTITNGNNVASVIVQKKTSIDFQSIGEIKPENSEELKNYGLVDPNPATQNYYRLQLIHKNNQITYSNIFLLRRSDSKEISIFPNPVSDVLNIEFSKRDNKTYQVSMINVLNQKVKEVKILNNGEKYIIQRTKEMTSGIYILHFLNLHTTEEFSRKIILK